MWKPAEYNLTLFSDNSFEVDVISKFDKDLFINAFRIAAKRISKRDISSEAIPDIFYIDDRFLYKLDAAYKGIMRNIEKKLKEAGIIKKILSYSVVKSKYRFDKSQEDKLIVDSKIRGVYLK